MTKKSVYKNIYWLLLTVACMNIITYFAWKLIIKEEPSVIILISMQIVYNFLIGQNIIRMIKKLLQNK